MKICSLYMYISAYINIIHTFKYTHYVQTVGRTTHQLDMHSRGIRSFPPNCWDISPFSEPRPAPTQTDSFSKERLSRTYYSLLGSVNCQKNAHKKTPTSSFCRFFKNGNKHCNNDNLSQLYIHPTPPEKTKTPHALKNPHFSPGLSLRHHFCGL